MNWLTKIFAGGVAEPVEAVGTALDKLFTSDDERLTRQEAIERLRQQPHLAQSAINTAEAQHRSVFVAGWRPFIGWVAGVSLAAYFLPQYALGAFLWGKASLLYIAQWTVGQPLTLPPYPVSAEGLMELTLGMLGLGLMRTAEKFGGRTK